MSSGIYVLYWDTNNYIYVGQSSNVEERFKDHLKSLKGGYHTNNKLTQVYLKYGNPTLFIVEQCSIKDLNSREIYWISEFDSYNTKHGLNRTIGGDSIPSLTRSHYSKFKILKVLVCAYKYGMTRKEISSRCNMHETTVKDIVEGSRHAWLKEEYPTQWAIAKNNLLRNKKEGAYRASIRKHGPIYLISPSGEKTELNTSQVKFEALHGLSSGSVSKLIKGTLKSAKGWKLCTTEI